MNFVVTTKFAESSCMFFVFECVHKFALSCSLSGQYLSLNSSCAVGRFFLPLIGNLENTSKDKLSSHGVTLLNQLIRLHLPLECVDELLEGALERLPDGLLGKTMNYDHLNG